MEESECEGGVQSGEENRSILEEEKKPKQKNEAATTALSSLERDACFFLSPVLLAAGDATAKKELKDMSLEEQRQVPLNERIGALKGAPREA